MDLDAWTAAFNAFLVEPGPWDFLASWARASQCLPVYCDWTHAVGVTEDGTFVAFEHDPWPTSARSGPPNGELADVRLVNVALYEGAKRYVWLKALLPPRPNDAEDCSSCGGTGEIPTTDFDESTPQDR